MTATEMEKRLSQLRTGFDLAIERTLRDKISKGWPIVVAGPDGCPVMRNAKSALADFNRLRRRRNRNK